MKKILVVDDEQEIRDLLKKKLERANYSVDVASNGEEAVLTSQRIQPDLVLLDIAMPVMDGYQTCQKLKETRSTKDIPVLFLTSKDLDPKSIAGHYTDLGACGYLPKPSTVEELLNKIKEIIG